MNGMFPVKTLINQREILWNIVVDIVLTVNNLFVPAVSDCED